MTHEGWPALPESPAEAAPREGGGKVIEFPKTAERAARVERELAMLKAKSTKNVGGQPERELLAISEATRSLREERAIVTGALRPGTAPGGKNPSGLFRRLFAGRGERARARKAEESRVYLESRRDDLTEALGDITGRLRELEERRAAALAALPEGRRRELEALEALSSELGEPSESRETSLERARKIMGADFLGAEADEGAFGFRPDRVPGIPWSLEELEWAKSHGEMLRLRVKTDAVGQPLDVRRMQALFQARHPEAKLLYSDYTSSTEPAALETALTEWCLVSKEPIPGSKGKDYFAQTLVLYDYQVGAGAIPRDAGDRERLVAEVAAIRAFYDKDRDANWKEAARRLAELPVNAQFRRRFAEQVQDLAAAKASGVDALVEDYDWGSSRHSDGILLCVGYAVAQGACVVRWNPGISYDGLGVCSSRSAF